MVDTKKTDKTKSSFTDKLPKLGKTSQLILLVGIFLIIFIPMQLVTNQQRSEIPGLQNEIANLRKIASSAPSTEKDNLESSIKQTEQNLDNMRAQFPSANDSARIIEEIMNLASSSGISMTKAGEGAGIGTVTVATGNVTSELTYPIQSYSVSLSGEASKIQSFILRLSAYPTCRVSSINLTTSGSESVMDTATIVIDIFLKGS